MTINISPFVFFLILWISLFFLSEEQMQIVRPFLIGCIVGLMIFLVVLSVVLIVLIIKLIILKIWDKHKYKDVAYMSTSIGSNNKNITITSDDRGRRIIYKETDDF